MPSLPAAEPVDVIAVVSGSCSPVTATQIAWARCNGFVVERLRLPALFNGQAETEIERCVQVAAQAAAQGRSPLLCSAEGPDDEAVRGFDALAAAVSLSREQAAQQIGQALAEVMRRLLARVPLQRVVVAGGDSSGEVASALGIAALTVQAGLAPGAPLCRAWRDSAQSPPLEMVLKGGQMGAASFFGSVRAGRLL